ncbi:MAG TPA: ClbS/DfsB family four-helix bundle protein [Chloroflexia bacterium]|nr:ClbS/DfsB family four-helix bundle protein [Chloroflexia bacterium]
MMAVTTKDKLLRDTEQSWQELNSLLDQLPEAQATGPQDAEGWTAKDHVIHMTAWERSVVFFLQGKPRHEGLGVEEQLYQTGDDDAINAVVYEQRKDLPLADALAQFQDVHSQLLNLLQPLSDADLQKPYRHYLPNEPSDGADRKAFDVIYANTADHFREHLGWIRALTGEA